MLVCSVSLRPPRRAIAAELAEVAAALDALGTGNIVFATLVDDPASVGAIVDAYLGEIMLEAANASDTAFLSFVYDAIVAEAGSASSAEDGSIAATVSYTTWNPADQGPQTVLSNGNLTATTSGALASVRSIASKASGKFYFETTWTGASFSAAVNAGPSIANASASLGSGGFAGETGSVGPVLNNGVIWNNNANSGVNIGAVSVGDVICCAVDIGGKLVWFRKNSGNWNGNASFDPATGVGGVSMSWLASAAFAMASTQSSVTVCTANFGASTFSGSVPSGFTPGWA